MNLTIEQLQDIMYAIRHYQYHHISISNPRYEEFTNILNVLIEEIKNENLSRHSRYRNHQKPVLDWIDRRSDHESDIDTSIE